MKKLSDLPRNTPVFVDMNILVLAGGEGRLAQQCRDFLNRVRQREVAGFTATFVAAEVTHRIMVKEARERLGLSSADRTTIARHRRAYFPTARRQLRPSTSRADGERVLAHRTASAEQWRLKRCQSSTRSPLS